jgi:hypothetical protein
MGQITENRLKMLEEQIKEAVVTPLEDGFYNVFVHGVVREDNIVKAESEEEALSKVDNLLREKTLNYAETSTGHVVIQPRSLK